MSTKYKLSDDVCRRMVQIFQEAILTGFDGAALLKEVEVEVKGDLVDLTPGYVESVKRSHNNLLSKKDWILKEKEEDGNS